MIAVTMPPCSRLHRMDPASLSTLSTDAPITYTVTTLENFSLVATNQLMLVRCDVVARIFATKVNVKKKASGLFSYRLNFEGRQHIV